MKILGITLFVICSSTVIGTAGGLLLRKIPHRFNDMVLGAASGIMLAAAVLGLIEPAASSPTRYAMLQTVLGVLAGAALISILDRITPHLHRLAGLDPEKHPHNQGTSRVLLFVSAIAIHKLPEGLAAGVSFGTGNPGDIITVAGAISLQNIPEALVIVAPLLAVGVSMKRTMFFSLLIGIVSMTGTLLGYGLVQLVPPVLPGILSFAGGTMLYVVSDEMIPETHAHGYEKQATFAMLSGFLLILMLQKLFG